MGETPIPVKFDRMSALFRADRLFRTDKTMDIGILKEPFLRLNQLFDDPFFLKHQDGPSIKSISNQYLDEYRTLEAVLSTIPQNITSS